MSRSTVGTESEEGLTTDSPRWPAQNSGEPAALQLVTKLCAVLEQDKIRYCHWKSNQALDRSATAENDLDLLVSRSHAERFTRILLDLGFKKALEPARKRVPGIEHYFGVDVGSSKLVHVHLHHQLVIGDDATKNYHLPIEEHYLDSATRESLFRVPSAEFEFIVLVIRLMLKHGTWDAILTFRGTLSARERAEIAYLSNRLDGARISTILEENLPFIDVDLFHRCARSLELGRSRSARMKAGWELSRCLARCARRPAGVDSILKLWRRATNKILRFGFRIRSKSGLAAGGAIVAVVGADGAGKSTTVDELHKWLSSHFVVQKVHLGKPPRSLASLVVRSLMRIRRSLGSSVTNPSPGAEVVTGPRLARSYAPLLRDVLTARDRYRAYVRAKRVASNGGIALCDRYPLSLVTFMDGPRVGASSGPGSTGRLSEYLARLEKTYYERISDPDVLVVLKVDPKTAVNRRIDEDTALVEERSSKILDLDWEQTAACVIDAGDPLPNVISKAKYGVWSQL